MMGHVYVEDGVVCVRARACVCVWKVEVRESVVMVVWGGGCVWDIVGRRVSEWVSVCGVCVCVCLSVCMFACVCVSLHAYTCDCVCMHASDVAYAWVTCMVKGFNKS